MSDNEKKIEAGTIKMFFLIVAEEMHDEAAKILYDNGARVVISEQGAGLARIDIFELLGFKSHYKSIITAIVKEENIEKLKADLNCGIFSRTGAGIAFSIKIDAFAGAKTVFSLPVEMNTEDK